MSSSDDDLDGHFSVTKAPGKVKKIYFMLTGLWFDTDEGDKPYFSFGDIDDLRLEGSGVKLIDSKRNRYYFETVTETVASEAVKRYRDKFPV